MTIILYTAFWFTMIAGIVKGPEVTRKWWR